MPVVCLQYEDLDALLGSLPSLTLHSSDDEDALCNTPGLEQVSHDACALAHSSASEAFCLICSLYSLGW